MFKKVAMTLGAIFLIGIVIVFLTGSLMPFLNGIWTWVFSTVFGMSTPPPSPFI